MTTADPRLWSGAYRQVRRWVLDRDRHLCQIHGPKCTRYATEVDHIIARADGGEVFDPRNMRAACRMCNGYLSAKRTNSRPRHYRTSVAPYEQRL